MVVAPLLLELGLHPLVAAATSSLMVLFSASTAALAFGFQGALNVTYALIFGISEAAEPSFLPSFLPSYPLMICMTPPALP